MPFQYWPAHSPYLNDKERYTVMKNMHGIIDPYTLGFLLSLAAALSIGPHLNNSNDSTVPKTQTTGFVKDTGSENYSQHEMEK